MGEFGAKVKQYAKSQVPWRDQIGFIWRFTVLEGLRLCRHLNVALYPFHSLRGVVFATAGIWSDPWVSCLHTVRTLALQSVLAFMIFTLTDEKKTVRVVSRLGAAFPS